jgi:signal transduction histidine kinase
MTISKFISSIILSIIAVGLGLLFYISSQEKKLESEISEIRASEEYKLVELFREECALLFNALDALTKESTPVLPFVVRAREHTEEMIKSLDKIDFFKSNKHFQSITRQIENMILNADLAAAPNSTEDERKAALAKYHSLTSSCVDSLEKLVEDAKEYSEEQKKAIAKRRSTQTTVSISLITLYIVFGCGLTVFASRALVQPLQKIVHSADESMNLGSPFVIEDKGLIREHVTLTWIIRMLIENLEENVRSRTLQLQKNAEKLKKQAKELQEQSEELQEQIVIREQLETQVVHSQKMETIGQMASMITHEVNTPMQFIMDNLYYLQSIVPNLEKASEEELKTYIEQLAGCIDSGLNGVQRVIDIVHSMKNFAHGGTDMMQIASLNDALEDTIIISTGKWKYVAEIVREFDPKIPEIQCRISELNQVFLNMIVNAAQAIEERGKDHSGKITVTTKYLKEAGMAEVSIKDNGCGIPKEIQQKVFEKFFTTKKMGVGTGQGLAVSVMVVEKHNGKIWLESEEGVGTTFFIQIPISPPEEERAYEGESI